MRPGQDLTFRLTAAGITMPHGGYQVTDTAGTLRYNGHTLGTITRDPAAGGRVELHPADTTRRAQITADLAAFARTCSDADGMRVTLSELLDALLADYQPPASPKEIP